MIKANLKDIGGWVISYHLSKDDRSRNGIDFICPVCEEIVDLKYGDINIPHFAHRGNTGCSHGVGESIEHTEIKCCIFDELLDLKKNIDMECRIGNRRADVVNLDDKIVYEIQLSPISPEEIDNRVKDYETYGYKVVWVVKKLNRFNNVQDYNKAVKNEKTKGYEIIESYKKNSWIRHLHDKYNLYSHIDGKFFIKHKITYFNNDECLPNNAYEKSDNIYDFRKYITWDDKKIKWFLNKNTEIKHGRYISNDEYRTIKNLI